ncbi:hypothetical protein [Escherichia coli]|uniref:hypothetical protein n=1 Tax=Escherichia coli TaxID=562 RepID=UPI0022646218|nr:hypothetical protein [Escherichia coli]
MHWNEKSGRYGVNISLIFWRVKAMCNDPNVTERKSAPLLDNRQNKGDRDRSPVGTKEIKRIANNARFAAGGQCDQCAGLLVGCQPLGSIPRCCNSLRSIRLIQVANEVSPSALAASSSCALNSSGSRIWYGGDRFSNGVDMVITLDYYSYMVITIVLTITQKTTPRTVGAVTGRLTKPLTGVTIMAGTQHTQTHPDYSSISTLEACHG